MLYSKESAKWKAYQFSDPFATNAFIVGNKVSQVYCKPDCDARPKTNLKNEVKFFTTADDAVNVGFHACKHCDPNEVSMINVDLLINCVATINEKIGFLKPLMDENEDVNNVKIKENILISKRTNEESILNVIDKNATTNASFIDDDGKDVKRRQSLPNISMKNIDTINLSKNDGDHYRLVDLACRHLAYAAAVNLFFPQKFLEDDTNVSVSKDGKKKRRRGGVLGFKELAAKSKLSAWHFHRVFKSVTGLTPKNYGDKCNDYLEKFKHQYNNHGNTKVTTKINANTMVDNHHDDHHHQDLSTNPDKDHEDYLLEKSNSLPDLTKYQIPTSQISLPQEIVEVSESPNKVTFELPELSNDLEINEILSSSSTSASLTPPHSSPEIAPSLFNYDKSFPYLPIQHNFNQHQYNQNQGQPQDPPSDQSGAMMNNNQYMGQMTTNNHGNVNNNMMNNMNQAMMSNINVNDQMMSGINLNDQIMGNINPMTMTGMSNPSLTTNGLNNGVNVNGYDLNYEFDDDFNDLNEFLTTV